MLIPKAHKVTVYSKLFNGEAHVHIGTPVHTAVSKPALFCALATLPCPENTFCRLLLSHIQGQLWLDGCRVNIQQKILAPASRMQLDIAARWA